MLKDIKSRIRSHSYMSQIERDKKRQKMTAEYFTPTELVQEMLETIPKELFTDPTKTFIDPACGDGQFLGEVLIKKIENGIDMDIALSTIYGVDIMRDNVDLCKKRLGGGNIIMGDTLNPKKKLRGQTVKEYNEMQRWFVTKSSDLENFL